MAAGLHLRLECPGCRRRLKIGMPYIGKDVSCKHCAITFEVPASLVLRCPHCDRRARVPSSQWGGAAGCGRCGGRFLIDGTGTIPGAPGPPRRLDRPPADPSAPPTDTVPLRARAEKAEGELQALRDELDRVRARLLVTSHVLGPAEDGKAPAEGSSIDALAATICERAERTSRIESSLAESHAEVGRLAAEVEAHRTEAISARDASARLAAGLDDARRRADEVAARTADEVKTLRAERDRLAAEVTVARSAASTARDASDRLAAERDEALGRTAALIIDRDQALRLNAELTAEASAANESAARLAAERDEALRHVTKLLAEREAGRPIHDDRSEAEASDAELARLREEVDRLRAEGEAERSEATAARDAAARLAAEHDDLLRRATAYGSERDEALGRVQEFALAARRSAEAVTTIRAECGRLYAESEARRGEAMAARDASARLTAERDQLLAAVRRVEPEIQALRAEVDRLRRAVPSGSSPDDSPPPADPLVYQDLALADWQPSRPKPATAPVEPIGRRLVASEAPPAR